MSWYETNWHFVTSQGGEFTGGEVFNIGGTGGSFFLENRRTHNQIELSYGAIGAGVGVGSPMNLDISLRDFPSTGIGNILARDRRRLDPEDFTGFFVMINYQGAGIGGVTVSGVYFNVPAGIMFLDHYIPGVGVPAAIAKGAIEGMTVGFQAGVAVMYYHGYLSLLG